MSEDTPYAQNAQNTPDTPSVAPAGCLLRLFWVVAGNAAIYLALATIAATKPPLPSSLDLVVGITLILMIAARWLDIARCDGRTISDEPATLRHWRRYGVMLAGATLAAWSLAHLIAGSFSR
jgi:hypothetical protein